MDLRNVRLTRGRYVAAVLISLALAACGGDGDDDGNVSPTVGPAQTAEALPTAIVADGILSSTAWKYTAAVPEAWTVSSNFIQSVTPQGADNPPYGGDALFAPESENTDPASQVRANIAITCEESDITVLDDLIADKVSLLESLSRRNIVVTDYGTVAGAPAKKIEYDLAREDLSFEKAEVYFLSPGCVRSVALTAQPGDRAKFTPQLDSVLASFSVQE
jgi:hypothetical protein